MTEDQIRQKYTEDLEKQNEELRKALDLWRLWRHCVNDTLAVSDTPQHLREMGGVEARGWYRVARNQENKVLR